MENNDAKTREIQYQYMIDGGWKFCRFGLMSGQVWYDDPKRLTFVLSRYKFISKMLSGKKSVLEVGCADAFATRIIAETVGQLTAIDFDKVFIENAKQSFDNKWPVDFIVHDITEAPMVKKFDAAYSIDVIEHISKESEDIFLSNIVESLTDEGVCIIGSPSQESQLYASQCSKEGHVNCKTGKELRSLMEKYFKNVFIFSMNDEVVHTGFDQMAHYRFALACSPRIL